jgi:hypothetical protein
MDAVAALFLGRVAAGVDRAEQFLEGDRLMAEGDHADAGPDAEGLALPGNENVLDRGAQLLGHALGIGRFGVAQQDAELVPAQPGEHVGLAQALGEVADSALSSASPAGCPQLSLTTLKRSRSSSSRAWFSGAKVLSSRVSRSAASKA